MSFLGDNGLQVKICGITNASDAAMCADAGADALGFNFFPGSPRYIEPDQAIPWIRALGGSPARVAVVVNPDSALLEKLRAAECFEWIQFHGDESPAACSGAGFDRWIKAARISEAADFAGALAFDAPGILLDAWSADAYGGTGKRLDWDLARHFVGKHPSGKILLAGGLNVQNVRQAVRIVRPHAVDVASGVELSPGKKEDGLVREFVRVAKAA
ncbi:MAG: phosphoribosylanthranilate isomerase [Verrucomicrobiae bacterium]